MKDFLSVINPEAFLASELTSDVIPVINSITNNIKEYKIAQSIEATKRSIARENARVQISALEENTKRINRRIDQKAEIASQHIEILDNIISSHDTLDSNMTEICIRLINASTQW
jgi:hypothetical protein